VRHTASLLVIAGLALAVAGIMLWGIGLANGWVRIALVAGGVCAIGIAISRSGYDWRPALRSRAARRGADALVAIALLTAVLVVLQALSMRHAVQLDLTRNQRHTLSPQTLTLLSTLDRDVTATAFVRQTSVTRAGVDELLDLYARRSPHFRHKIVDPDRQPDLAERLHAGPDEIVLEAGDRRSLARNAGEESLTGALIQVTRTELKAVYFVTGHGEKDIQSTDRDGYSAARMDLERQGYAPRPLSLLNGSPVPSDAAVVVVAGPRYDYLSDEINALSDYTRRGGSLLIMIDPRISVPRISELLAQYGLSVLDAVVLDEKELRAGNRTFDATVVKVRTYEQHPITRGFNYITMFPRARPVFIAQDSLMAGRSAHYLGISDRGSWGEKNMDSFKVGTASRDGTDLAGPLPISAVATLSPIGRQDFKKSHVVLVGDSDFANNVFWGVIGNSDWFLNTVAFLSEDEGMITIRPRESLRDQIYLSEKDGRLVFLLCIVLLPAVSLGTGIAVILRRARL
jgi:ABC-type uncharacterized transport system involved in gliding motility auxiliary subunit